MGSSSSQVEFALEQILLRKFGGNPKQNEVVKRELADVLSAGPMTEERMKELQLRLADLLIAAGSKRCVGCWRLLRASRGRDAVTLSSLQGE